MALEAAKPSASFDDLVREAEALHDAMQPQEALQLYAQALKLRPDDAYVLDSVGELLFETGDEENAKAALARSAKLAPEAGFTKWMYLGQLSEGQEAVAAYSRGIAVLKGMLAKASAEAGAGMGAESTSQELARLRRELSNALVSLAELYMTDLCDEPEAESQCDKYGTEALAVDSNNPEACQMMANFRLCQKKPADAVPLLRRAVELCEALDEDGADEGEEDAAADAEGGADDEDGEDGAMADSGAAATAAAAARSSSSSGGGAGGGAGAGAGAGGAAAATGRRARRDERLFGLPSYESRFNTAKMCMEVEAYAPAVSLLERLLEEDDTSMEVWFYTGEAQHLSGDNEAAAQTLQTADAMLAAALAAKGKKGSSARASSAVAAASATAPVDFTFGAMESLMELPVSELEVQRTQIRRLLTVVTAALAGAGGAGGPAAAASGADAMADS